MHAKIAAMAVGTTFAMTKLAQHLTAPPAPSSEAPRMPQTSHPLTETQEARQLRARLGKTDSPQPPHRLDLLEEDTIREMVHLILR